MDPFKQWESWKPQFDSFFGKDFLSGFDQIFKQGSGHTFPLVNIYQTENELICLANIPGLNSLNNVDVFVEYQSIELKGSVQLHYNGFQRAKEEIYQGQFERKIELPFPVKEDRVEATYQNGLLIIHLHRLIPDGRSRQKISIKKIEE